VGHAVVTYFKSVMVAFQMLSSVCQYYSFSWEWDEFMEQK